MHVEISMAKHGSAGGPFVGYVRGLVGIVVFCFAGRQACMRGQPFTWGEDNLGCRWHEDGMGAQRGKKDHANGWTSLSMGHGSLYRLEIGPTLLGPKWARLGPTLGQKKKTQ